MPEKIYLARYIKDYRRRNQLSQFEMAEECGVHADTISLIEREHENLKLETMQKIAAYIGCTVSEMLCGDETYRIVESSIVDEKGIRHSVYGVEAVEVAEYLNIFADFNEAQQFVEICNRLELSPIHIRDVIDDFINS